mgnify:CR=1 FL=1
MKLKIDRDHFVTGLQQVSNVVGTRASMPVLNNVLIKISGGQMALTTTNLDLGIRCSIKAEAEGDVSITLPVRKLLNIVKALPNKEVTIDFSGSNLVKITSGGSKFKIMGIAEEEFPPLPSFADEHEFVIDQVMLHQMLRNVAYAQSSDENRHMLNGVFFNFSNAKLTVVATDGRRLALCDHNMEIAEDNAGSFILPAKTVAELLRLLGHGNDVKVTFNDRQVAFEISIDEKKDESGLSNCIYLVSKIVEGHYPNYKQVIPKEIEHRIKIDRELFQECVQRASLVTSDKNNSVKIKVGKNLLEISGSSPEVGEAHESIAIAYEGPDVQVAFNPQFLMDPLKALVKDEVYFEFKDDLSPGLFKTLDSFMCVIMPLRLN